MRSLFMHDPLAASPGREGGWLVWLPAAQTSGFYEMLPYAEILVIFVSLPLAWKAGIIGTAWYFNKHPIE